MTRGSVVLQAAVCACRGCLPAAAAATPTLNPLPGLTPTPAPPSPWPPGQPLAGSTSTEPYAYWSLDRRMLNRRKGKQASASTKLAAVVGGAKAGALKGAKAKRTAAKRVRTAE
jgi:hypothetical protein